MGLNFMSELRRDPAIKKWLAYYEQSSHDVKISFFHDFFKYVRSQSGFETVSPSDLVTLQKEALKNGDEYRILDILQQYILQKEGTFKTLQVRNNVITKFFSRNRAPLPEDDFCIKASRSSAPEKLSVDVIKMLIENSSSGIKAFYLTLWMGILDQERFFIFNRDYGSRLSQHLKEKGVDEPFMIELHGRKASKNRTKFYSFLGRDCLVAWQTYFERLRGYPRGGEPILLDGNNRIMSKHALKVKHLRLLERLNYIKRGGDRSMRYGFHMHEFRDVARTMLHLQGRKDGLDLDCVEFFMGHVTDPNRYDKFFMDREYMLSQYRIAEKSLNIVSGTSPKDVQELLEERDQEIKELKNRLDDLEIIYEERLKVKE